PPYGSVLVAFLHSQLRPPAGFPLFPCTTLFRSPQFARHGAKYPRATRLILVRQQYCCVIFKTDVGAVLAPYFLLGANDDRLGNRSEEHTSELQSRENIVCRLLLDKKKTYEKGSV